jgi:hypothetical protein
MERNKALALAATITCVLGSTAVAAASVGGTSILGFGGGSDVRFASVEQSQDAGQTTPVVRRTKNVYDKVVVDGTTTPAGRSTGTRSPGILPAAPGSVIPAETVTTRPEPGSSGSEGAGGEVHRRRTSPSPTAARTPPTRAPSEDATEPTTAPPDPPSTTTAAPVTTTTRPPGVPKDWPPDKPIPPMPPNCHQPQLEDNGVWNCQDN